MKRLILLLLPLVLLLSTACGVVVGSSEAQSLVFYYCKASADSDEAYSDEIGALETQPWVPQTKNITVVQILEQYLKEIQTADLQSPFPKDLIVKDCALDSGVLTINFSEMWLSLSGLEKTMAQACLVYTMTQLPEVDAVRIRCHGDGDVLLTREDFLVADDSDINDEEMP